MGLHKYEGLPAAMFGWNFLGGAMELFVEFRRCAGEPFVISAVLRCFLRRDTVVFWRVSTGRESNWHAMI